MSLLGVTAELEQHERHALVVGQATQVVDEVPDVGAALHLGIAVLGGRNGAPNGVEVDDDAPRGEQRRHRFRAIE